MNLAYAREEVARVLRMSGDPEVAHSADDDLRREFIEAIAKGELDKDEAAEIAELLLTTEDKFARWCA